MKDYKKALLDPTLVFKMPQEILDRKDLSREQKIKVLTVWEYDAREIEVAEEENMMTDKPNMLIDVLDALNKLNARRHHKKTASTKHGDIDVNEDDE